MLPKRLAVLSFMLSSPVKASFWLGAQDILYLRTRQPSKIVGEQGPCHPFARWKNEPLLGQINFNKKIKFNNNNVEVMDLKISSLQISICKHRLKNLPIPLEIQMLQIEDHWV